MVDECSQTVALMCTVVFRPSVICAYVCMNACACMRKRMHVRKLQCSDDIPVCTNVNIVGIHDF